MGYQVYKHTTPSGKIYIGITRKTGDLSHWNGRWGCNGIHYRNQIFHKAIEKYGWDNITHEVLYTNLTRDEALQMEVKLIAEYKSNDPRFGYNRTQGGDGYSSYHTDDTKQRISDSLHMYYKDHKPGNIRPIDCYHNGVYYKSFPSAVDAAKELNIHSPSSIVNILRGWSKKTKQGYSFVYREEV